ncbi:flhB HrpN YscU SpaS family protein, partial [Escherichia coli]|nr:flhB HrpN YscU SpaS family protein [Escherichia coli]
VKAILYIILFFFFCIGDQSILK